MRLGRAALAIALLSTAACNATISNGGRAGRADANPGDAGDTDDAGEATDASVDAPPVATCAARTLYLNFDGQTLQRDATSNAITNHASWLNKSQGTAPPYRAGNAGRAAKIAEITDGVRARLSIFPITVVTTRPATGEYVMVVLGGNASQIGSNFTGAVNQLDCDDSEHNDVAWLAENLEPTTYTVNTVLGAVGFGLGLTATNDPDDCMCSWANRCTPNTTVPCKLGAPIARDPNPFQGCPGAGTTQNEVATLRTAFCGPP